MENIKVRVKNEVESTEVQGLFERIGGISHNTDLGRIGLVVLANDIIYVDMLKCEEHYTNKYKCKELTIPQLRDLVVLNRNDVGDRNVIDPEYNSVKLYLDSNNKLFVFYIPTQKWKESHLSGKEEVMKRLKPIEKKEMKEFLVNHNDKWTLQLLDADTEENSFRVAVPSGYNIAVKKQNGDIRFSNDIETYFGEHYIWQRHTHPEELPFVDYEPKIETATGYQLDVVGKNTYGSRSRNGGESDISYRQYLMNFILYNKRKSLNDMYAEIEQVRQDMINNPNQKTIDAMREAEGILSQKHNHYFKDVSDIERVDVYEVLKRFEVTDPCLQHIVKKALCAGQRGHKDFRKDLQDILDTAVRAVDINK